ncbi:ATP-dependent DNA ligase [Streptomyces telluris]|uniref:ATP-dependent DNA ligase n=1 Tax=Streptomyces telluris TaxID=2720021 RepID=A0A9X2LPH8_9ACTN|nr:ATP-dependent DNA ligase [Streptomyces telluris]MCQ8775069.1 ATP-dependent DNA ligase [Streptomyces telluris]
MPFIQSRRGADLGSTFPKIARAASALGVEAVMDAELVVWNEQRLDFTALQHRARRRGPTAERAARQQPAHLIVFDLLELSGTVLLDQPLYERRAALEDLFATHRLSAPWALCPQTADIETARTWLAPAWGAAGIEGIIIKDPASRYRPGQRGGGWLKLRARTTEDGIIAGVSGPVRSPHPLLLGRYNTAGRLRFVGRTTPLSAAARHELGTVLVPGGPGHPWAEVRISAGWDSKEDLQYNTVQPDTVAEYRADTAAARGRHRHPVRYLRIRSDLTPAGIEPLRSD